MVRCMLGGFFELQWIGLNAVGLGCTKCVELGFKERLAGKAATLLQLSLMALQLQS